MINTENIKHETSESISKSSSSDNERIDLKPQQSRSPSQTWAPIEQF